MATQENNQSNEQGAGSQQRNTIRRDNEAQDGAMQQEFSGMNHSQYAPDGEKKAAGAEQGQARSPKQDESRDGSQENGNDGQHSGDQGQGTGNQNQSGMGNTIKDPDNWTTGEQPMTGAQNSYLHTLASEAGEQVNDDLTKAEASKKIDELQQKTGRGVNQDQ
jgi:hypothetical protein